MEDDQDAARIQQERERRRAAERLRIDRERIARQIELARLDGTTERSTVRRESSSSSSGRRPPPPSTELSRSSATPAGGRPDSTPTPAERPKARAIGAAIASNEVRAFLDPQLMDRFDLSTLNRWPWARLLEGTQDDPETLEAVATRLEQLMQRVKKEVDDPLAAGAFLREQVVRWYEESSQDEQWAERMPEVWGGLFAESKGAGGRSVPWINVRLAACREAATREGRLGGRLRRKLSRDRSAQSATLRSASQQINGEVAQAILDDLATHRREPESPLPLVRLSELAVRRQIATVSDSLAMIFNGPETGPFVVLHPNRYPRCEEMLIRPPSPGSSGAALAYSLTPGRSIRRGPARARGPGESGSAAGGRGEGEEPGDGEDGEVDASTLWEAPAVPKDVWKRVVAEAKRSRTRLDSPPKDYRGRAAYVTLRELALEDETFRSAFLAAKWRGRPAGLPLLIALLQKGTLAPEVATDHEYLEAELGELVQGDPNFRPADSTWSPPGWKIVREGNHPEGYKYRAERSP